MDNRIEAGKIVGTEVIVVLPPVVESFHLPKRDSLLGIKVGQLVKVMFAASKSDGGTWIDVERMWIKITDNANANIWKGTLVNHPVKFAAQFGDPVEFHPLSVIDVVVE